MRARANESPSQWEPEIQAIVWKHGPFWEWHLTPIRQFWTKIVLDFLSRNKAPRFFQNEQGLKSEIDFKYGPKILYGNRLKTQNSFYINFGPVRILVRGPDFWSEIFWSGTWYGFWSGLNLVRSEVRILVRKNPYRGGFFFGPVRGPEKNFKKLKIRTVPDQKLSKIGPVRILVRISDKKYENPDRTRNYLNSVRSVIWSGFWYVFLTNFG